MRSTKNAANLGLYSRPAKRAEFFNLSSHAAIIALSRSLSGNSVRSAAAARSAAAELSR